MDTSTPPRRRPEAAPPSRPVRRPSAPSHPGGARGAEDAEDAGTRADPEGGSAPASGCVSRLGRPAIGQLGEDIAAAHLKDRGWYLLERNYRAARGEIDIIALDGTTLVFVEVKTRRTVWAGLPQESVTPQKLRRIRLMAGHYLQSSSPPHHDLRIDVIAVMLSDGEPPRIEHLRAVGS